MNSSTTLSSKMALHILEEAVEAGRRPLLALGPDAVHPEGLANLPVLTVLHGQVRGPLAPYWIAGEADLWFLAGLAWSPWPTDSPVLYAGNDRATFVAAADIATPEPDTRDWPPGLVWSLLPQTLPGARTEPEQIPLTLAAQEGPIPPPTDRWSRVQAWLALAVGLAMLIAAWLP